MTGGSQSLLSGFAAPQKQPLALGSGGVWGVRERTHGQQLLGSFLISMRSGHKTLGKLLWLFADLYSKNT